MKFPAVSDIKTIRKSLDVTQARLAQESGVSQGTIAKIEGGKISASYETVVRLFETLENIRNGRGMDMKAIEVASPDVVSVKSTDLVHNASDVMRSTGFSQLPVIDGDVPVGSISERTIFDMLRDGITMDDLGRMPVEKVMGEPYPMVSDTTPISAITRLMAVNNAVLVSRKGMIVGVITNADILKLVRGPSERSPCGRP